MGCGQSDLNTNISFGIANQAQFLYKLIDKLGSDKFHLIAHDVGGGIAQIMNVKRPNALLSVSLINTVAYDFWPVQPIISMRIPIIRQFAVATIDLWTLKLLIKRGLYHNNCLTPELIELFGLPFKQREGRKAFLHFAACLNNAELLQIEDELHELDTPFLVVRGDTDAYLSTAITDKLIENLKICERVIIPTGGHYIQEDEPELVANVLLEFIRKHER